MDNNKIVKWVLKIGLLVVPVLPLVVTSSLFFPFITGRNFIFRILIEVLFVFWIWLLMKDPDYRPRSSLIFYSVIATISVLFLSTIFSISPYKSFWSSFERMEGFWAFWHYLLYFLMLASVFKKDDWFRFFSVSLLASVAMSFYALLQFLGKLNVHQGGVRLDGTMGNATYLAIYLIFHIFIFSYFFLKAKSKIWRSIFGLAIILELFITYHTATRGALLGLLIGLAIFALVNIIWSKGKSCQYSIGILAVIIGIPIIFMLFRQTSLVNSSMVLSRFANISLDETTTQSRFIIWNMAYQAWKERPILGWGPESFIYVFSKYYDARMWRQEPWFDRAHNVFFDWLTSAGLVGLLAYLAMFVSSFWLLLKSLKKKIINEKVMGLSLGVLAAYFVHNFFVFDNFTSYIMFFALLAFWHHIYTHPENGETDQTEPDRVILPAAFRAVVTSVVFVAVIFSVYAFNVKPILASKSIIDTLRAVTYSRSGDRVRDLDQGLAIIKQGLSYSTFGTAEIREQLAQDAEKIAQDPATNGDDKDKFTNLALAEMEKQVRDLPYDVRAKAFLSTLYGDAKMYPEAILMAQEGLKISAQRQQFYFLLGEAYFKAGDEKLALETMKSAYDLAPDFPDAIHNYAMTVIFAGRPEIAESLLEKHFGVKIYPNPRYVNAYAAIGDFKKLALVWEALVEKEPDNPQYRLGLASAYIKIFQDQKAIAQLQKAIELSPQFKQQGEAYIKQIKEGRLQR